MEFKIDRLNSNQRIDKFIKRILPDAPLSFIYKMFRKKDVKVNGQKATINYLLKEGDEVYVYIKEDLLKNFHKEKGLRPVKVDFETIYEDDNILLVTKKKGVPVHKEDEEKRKVTLQDMVLNYLYQKGEYNPTSTISFTPAACHRLDTNTSGIVIFGKNLITQQEMLKLFKEKEKIKKKYLLLVKGVIDKKGIIDLPLKKDSVNKMVHVSDDKNAKSALTIYERKKIYSEYSLVEAELKTGRTHQLRVHFAYIHHPIIGDSKYGDFKINEFFKKMYGLKSQFLHAYYFKFGSNIGGHLDYLSDREFISPLPKMYEDILESLKGKNR